MAEVKLTAVIEAQDNASQVMRRFANETDKANEKIEEASKKAGFFKTNLNAAGLAAGGFLTGLGLLGKSAITAAASFEQTKIGITNMVGSAAKASDLLNEISQFAAKTPFEFPELATTTKQLLSFGFGIDDAMASMKMLGDVSASMNVPIGDLAYLFGTLRAQGRAFTIDIRQFAMRGIPIYEYLGQVLKTDTAGVQEMVEAGKVGFPEVEKAFTLMTSAGGRFAGGMEAQSRSLTGLFSTLSDNVGFVTRQFLGIDLGGNIREGSIFAIVKQGVDALITGLQAVTPYLVQAADWLTQNKIAMIAIAGAITGLVVLAFYALITAIAGALVVMGTFMLVGAAVGALAYLIISNWQPIKTFFIDLWNTITNGVTMAFDWVRDRLIYLKNNWAEVLGYMIGFFVTLPIKLPFYVYEAFKAIIGYLTSINWGAIFSSIGDSSNNIWEGVKNAAINAWNFLKNIKWGEILTSIARGIGNAIIGLIEGAIKGAMSGIPGLDKLAGKINIPRFANGVTNFSGGLAVVGERGAELVNLPRGADVIPNNKIGDVGGKTINIYQNNTIYRETDTIAAARALGFELARA